MSQGDHPDHPPVEGGYTGNPKNKIPPVSQSAVMSWLAYLENSYRPSPVYHRQECIAGLNYCLKPLNVKVVDHDYSF